MDCKGSVLFADDVEAVTKILGKEMTQEDGKQYMRTEKLLVDFSIGKSRFRIRDYLNDGNILGKGDGTCAASADQVLNFQPECFKGPVGYFVYRQFNIQTFRVLPTQCIYVFCVDLRTNSDYFTVQH